MGRVQTAAAVLLSWLLAPSGAHAQAPAATLTGAVTDVNSGVVPGATVTAAAADLAISRQTSTDRQGRFRFDSLPPGRYEIDARLTGFRRAVHTVELRAGDATSVSLRLEPGDLRETLTVVDGPAPLNTSEFRVARSIGPAQVEHLPLNGRGVLDLAQLEPGVTVTSVANPGLGANNYQRLNLAGAFFHQTRLTVDGSTNSDRFVGGTLVNLSQETVAEFQVATFNADPAMGVTGAGAVNVVTRQGTSQLRGSAFFAYRDDELSAYPALRRDPRVPEPSFARRQLGASVGGPLLARRLFGFATYERNDQDGVFAIANNHPVFSKLDVVHPSPLTMSLGSARVDGVPAAAHRTSVRVSGDRNDAFTPANQPGMPSNWQPLANRAYQIQLGVSSVFSGRVVNDLRYAVTSLDSTLEVVRPEQCRDPIPCTGVGGVSVLVFDAPQFRIGRQVNAPFPRHQRNFQLLNTITWQHGRHTFRIGGEWEHLRHDAAWAFNDPAQIVLWGPSNLDTPVLRPLYDRLPASLRSTTGPPPTFDEILQLPLRSFSMGIGSPSVPGPYNFDKASRNDRFRVHVHDNWQAGPRLTVSAGLAYVVETQLFDHDLDLPPISPPSQAAG
jgi:hypothetical protein